MKYLIYTIGLIYLLISFNYGINIYDEGIPLVGGMRVLAGELPFKDFWTIYPPGIFYLSAIIQTMSDAIWLHKLIAVIILFVLSIKLNQISNLLTNKKHYLTFICSIVLTGFGLKYMNNSMLGLLLSSFAVCYAINYFKSKVIRNIFYCGLFIGLTSVFRHDFAVYLLVPMLLTLLFEFNSVNKLKKFAILFLGLSPAIIFYFVFASLVGFETVVTDMFIFPLTKFSETRYIPFPLVWNAIEISDSLSNYLYNVWQSIVFLIPPLVSIISYLMYRRQKYNALYAYLGLTILLFYNQALNRSDYSHLLPSLLIAIPLLVVLLKSVQSKFYRKLFIVFFTIIVLIIPIAKKLNYAKRNYLDKSLVLAKFPTSEYIYIESNLNERYKYISELNNYIIHNRPTFIGLKEMSNIEVNDVISYYLLGLEPQTKYHELHPGIADSQYYQQLILEELVRENKFVLLLDIKNENDSHGSNYFNENLTNHYRYVIKTLDLELLVNKRKSLIKK